MLTYPVFLSLTGLALKTSSWVNVLCNCLGVQRFGIDFVWDHGLYFLKDSDTYNSVRDLVGEL